jgi:hypothetical protein
MNLKDPVVKNVLVTTMTLTVGSRCFPIHVLTDLPHNFFDPPSSLCNPECRLDDLVQEIIAARHQPVLNSKYVTRRGSRSGRRVESSAASVQSEFSSHSSSSLLDSKEVKCSSSSSSGGRSSTEYPQVEEKSNSLQRATSASAQPSFSNVNRTAAAEETDDDTDGDFQEQSELLSRFRIRMDTTVARRTERALLRQERRQFPIVPIASTSSLSSAPLCTGRLCHLPVDPKKAVYCTRCNSIFHSKSCLRFYQNSHDCN